MNTTNKVALVTGVTRGIGRSIAEMLIKNDYNIIGIYKNNDAEANNLKSLFKDSITLLKIDISSFVGLEQIHKIIESFDRLDLLVNNAGFNQVKFLSEITLNDWDLMINTHLRSTVFLTKFLYPYLHKNNGVIINISSRAGFPKSAFVDTPLYDIAKAGINNFTVSTSKFFKEENINVRINAVIPAPTKTDLLKNVFSEEELEELDKAGKLGKPEEVAQLVWELTTDSNANGKILIDKRLGEIN